MKQNWQYAEYANHPHFEIYYEFRRIATIEDHITDAEEIARLIAAAPELLEACQEAIADLDLAQSAGVFGRLIDGTTGKSINMPSIAISKIKEAIKKAKGES